MKYKIAYFLIVIFTILNSNSRAQIKNNFKMKFPYLNEIFYSQFKFKSQISEEREVIPKKRVLNLKEAIYLALSNNLDLKIEKLKIKESIARYFGSQSIFEPFVENKIFYKRNVTPSPSVFQGVGSSKTKETFFSSSLTKKFSPGTTLNFTFETKKTETNNIFFLINPAYNTTLSISLRQPLLKGFGRTVNEEKILISNNNISIFRESYKKKAEEIIFEVAKEFYDILIAKKNFELSKRRVLLAKKTLEDVRLQVKSGVRPILDEKKAEAEFYRQKANLIEAETELNNLKASFLTFLFQAEDTEKYVNFFKLKDEDIKFKKYDFERAKKLALENYNLKISKYALKNSQITLKARKKNLKPQLDLVLGYLQYGLKGSVPDLSHFPFHIDPDTQDLLIQNYSGGVYDSIGNAFKGKYNGISLELDFKIPIGNKEAKAEAISAEIEYENNLNSLKKVKQNTILQLRNIYRNLKRDLAKIKTTEKEIKAAEEELNGEKLKFKYEVSTVRDLIEAQNKYFQAVLSNFSAEKEYKKDLLTLHKITSDLHTLFGIKFK